MESLSSCGAVTQQWPQVSAPPVGESRDANDETHLLTFDW